jgi:hypothetical protein
MTRSVSSPRFGRRMALSLLGLALSGAALATAPGVRADNSTAYVVIVHPDNPRTLVERDFVRELFLKQRSEWPDGSPAKPADQRPNTRVREAFSSTVLGRTVAAVKSYWQQRIFAGRGVPPPELESDEAVIAFVARNRGGIGYVSASADLGGAKSITIK